jgi:uncharacterized protein YraI
MLRRGLFLFMPILIALGLFAVGHAAPVEQTTLVPATFPIIVTVQRSANVRSGPGTEFSIISGARAGQRLSVIGCNLDCSWYQLAEDCWIAAFLVLPEQAIAPPQVTAGLQLPTNDARLPTVVVSVPITVTGATTQTTHCPQTLAPVNTYAGPGTFYPVVDTRPAAECVAVIGRNAAGDWFQLSHGMWILAAAVLYADPIETMPVTEPTATPTPQPPSPLSTPASASEPVS